VTNLKVIVEKHADGYFAYPLGMKGVVVAEGDSYDEVLANVRSAIAFHVDTFGRDVLEGNDEPIEVFVAEAAVPA
jgi:predicted RNase H-like HicB family nuclease